MGGCVSQSNSEGSNRAVSPSHQLSSTTSNSVTIGKNKPLHSSKPKWKSETPITMVQLLSKRNEYWDTQPAFGGREEIYNALRAACETDDNVLAQAIINGANIKLPTGSLSDAYDELGNHYTIPVYCISLPTNLIQSDDTAVAVSASSSKEKDGNGSSEQPSGEEIVVKIRLSTTNKDIKMSVHTGETIGAIKRRIQTEHAIPPGKQRCFFAGKLLYDKLTIEATKIQKGYVIQVIVAES